ncbi:MAG: hypothetical protein OXE53_12055, partial [Deltaproteobacteria bacterium]|nr:hypothetical protein [Deltaproteobacteria bacterium]
MTLETPGCDFTGLRFDYGPDSIFSGFGFFVSNSEAGGNSPMPTRQLVKLTKRAVDALSVESGD